MRLIDVFAGAGGVTTGAIAAGFTVVAALNHNARAITTHAANHPTVRHYQDDALAFDWRDLPAHEFGHLSPECTYYTDAQGAPREGDAREVSRATARCTIAYARACAPQAITVENVTEYGASPEALSVVLSLGELGYHHQRLVIDAAHCDTPQYRERLFDVFTLRAVTIRPPTPRELVPASRVIDLEGGRWNRVEGRRRPLVDRTLRQIEVGRVEFGGRPFLVPYYGSKRRGTRVHVRSLDRPIGTLTTVDRYAVVRRGPSGAWEIRMLTPNEQARATGFPAGYVLTGTRREQVRQVGNAVCPPVATWLLSRVREAVLS